MAADFTPAMTTTGRYHPSMAVAPDLIVDVVRVGPRRAAVRMARCCAPGSPTRSSDGTPRSASAWAFRRPTHVAGLLAATRFVPAIEASTPELLEEVRGIAEGAGVSFERILAYNLMDEEWWYSQARRATGTRAAWSRSRPARAAGRSSPRTWISPR